MKKKLVYITVLLNLFVLVNHNVLAEEKSAYISCNVAPDGLNLRDGINGNITEFLTCGNDITVLESDLGSTEGVCISWSKVKYKDKEYFACGDYITVKEVITEENKEDFKKRMKEIGFPNEYIDKLTLLHEAHPNWQFKPFLADIKFNDMVNKEYRSEGWSLVEDTGHYFDGYKSVDSWSYDYLKDKFNNSFVGGGSNWYAASKETISYYMDPRNFLDDNHIFMFESLSYNSAYHTKAGIEAMLKGTFMENGYADEQAGKTFADAFIDAAKAQNVSPYVLASRVIQEVGAGGSTIVSGTVSGYEGYYNFYNIQAYGSNASETIARGLSYAKSQGWDTKYKAIVGGASFLSSNYINAGQDTLYLQKWDLFGPLYGNHQYMQNIQAPYTESVKTYRGYLAVGLNESNFVFSIPVFPEMPSSTKLPNKGNPNNYLSSLIVGDIHLFDSATYDTSFNVELEESITSVEIKATKVNNKATIDGLGTIELNNNIEVVPITVIAENGSSRVYTINIKRLIDESKKDDTTDDKLTDEDNDNTNENNGNDKNKDENDTDEKNDISSIDTILKNQEIKTEGNYILGYELDTDINTIVDKIKANENITSVEVKDQNNKEKADTKIASGDKFIIKTENEEKTYILVIYGDVNGDSKISSADYILIKNHIMETSKLSEIQIKFADATKDGKVNSADYVAIKNHIMDVKKITQK